MGQVEHALRRLFPGAVLVQVLDRGGLKQFYLPPAGDAPGPDAEPEPSSPPGEVHANEGAANGRAKKLTDTENSVVACVAAGKGLTAEEIAEKLGREPGYIRNLCTDLFKRDVLFRRHSGFFAAPGYVPDDTP